MVRRPFAQAAIAFFCAWHAFAIAVSAIPLEARDPVSLWVRGQWLPAVWPYVALTSQWQRWNLFSPDPSRRVASYAVEVQGEGGQWSTLVLVEPWSAPWWRRAREAALLTHALESGREGIFEQFLLFACRDHALPPDASVRLLRRLAILPASSLQKTSVMFATRCPPSP